MAHAIEDALLKSTKIEAKPDEPRKKYLSRLVRAAAQLVDDAWKSLPNEAQIWVNAAGKAMNAKVELPEFDTNIPAFMVQHKLPGYEKFAAAVPAPTTPAPAPAATAAPAPAATAATAPAATPTSTPATPAPVAAPGEKKKGGTAFFRRLAVENPDWDQKKCLEMTHQAGFPVTVNTAAITYYEARATLKILSETGGLTPEVKAKVDAIKPKVRTPPAPPKKKTTETTGAASAPNGDQVQLTPTEASVSDRIPVTAGATDDE